MEQMMSYVKPELIVGAVLFMITHLKHSCYMICKRKKKV